MAVSVRATARQAAREHYSLGGARGGVQVAGPRGCVDAVGRAQEEAQHELRQAESRHSLLLRQEDHAQGSGQALRLQVQL